MAVSMTLVLNRNSLTNVDDAAGRWQHEGGTASRGNAIGTVSSPLSPEAPTAVRATSSPAPTPWTSRRSSGSCTPTSR